MLRYAFFVANDANKTVFFTIDKIRASTVKTLKDI